MPPEAQAHLLRGPRVILRDELGKPVPEEIGGTVADVQERALTGTNRGDHHRAAHARPVGVVARGVEDRAVGFFARLLQTLDVRAFLTVLGKDRGHRLHRDRARVLTGGMPTHPVADDDERVQPGLVPPHRNGVFVLFALETGIGGPRDT